MPSKPLKVIFAGTPDFAIPSLEALIHSELCEVIAVYSQPDRKAGRGRKVLPTPIKKIALAHDIAVETPANFKEVDDREQLASYQPDLMVVAAYGLLLPQSVLDIPKYGCINVHASLLPRWRGAAPVQAAILAGDAETGVDIMRMEKGLDTGGVYCERKVAIDPMIDAGALTQTLAQLGAEALIACITEKLYQQEAQPQSEQGVTYAHKIQKAHALIDWNQSAEVVQRHIRAYWPWPGAFSFYGNKRIKIAAAEIIKENNEQQPGTIIAVNDAGITVACGEGQVVITQCQPEGKQLGDASHWKQYFSAGQIFIGD